MADKSNSDPASTSPEIGRAKVATVKTVDDDNRFVPKEGERAVIIGQTGSGKTTLVTLLLERIPQSPIIVYDPKHDAKLPTMLKQSRIVTDFDRIEEALDDGEVDYVIMRPDPSITSEPDVLDAMLVEHEKRFHHVGAYIDELYFFHRSGRAGPGLIGLFTRGRSRGITTLAATQRPAWVSGFVFSETQMFYIFDLSRKSDRKRVSDFIDGYDELPRLPIETPAEKKAGRSHHFYIFRQGTGKPELQKPVPPPIDKGKEFGYVDTQDVVEAPASGGEENGERRPKSPIGHLWV